MKHRGRRRGHAEQVSARVNELLLPRDAPVLALPKMHRDSTITERKHTEKALRESEARLQATVDLLKLGRYAWNPQTNEWQWDETLRPMWGLPLDGRRAQTHCP